MGLLLCATERGETATGANGLPPRRGSSDHTAYPLTRGPPMSPRNIEERLDEPTPLQPAARSVPTGRSGHPRRLSRTNPACWPRDRGLFAGSRLQTSEQPVKRAEVGTIPGHLRAYTSGNNWGTPQLIEANQGRARPESWRRRECPRTGSVERVPAVERELALVKVAGKGEAPNRIEGIAAGAKSPRQMSSIPLWGQLVFRGHRDAREDRRLCGSRWRLSGWWNCADRRGGAGQRGGRLTPAPRH